uniref:FYVE and coiled-coil domain autophagy adaptor 1 n=1 Tax=Nothobranchius furzeri TaxID=105023 RepID=A0A8C6M8Y9_NOTFU
MASSSSVGDKQLQRIIRDLQDAVFELSKEHQESGEPITDDSSNLHKFFYKLEYLLQFDQKEKTTFLGQRKDYWDYFCDCLIKIKGANDGIRFVKSIPEVKTSLGKGRTFVRYSLVHQRLADSLQQCFINQKVTSDWYYARSPFLKPHITADIINHLYELNQIQFDVAARGYDLDADWPTFARRTLGAASSAHMWKPLSRCSSINSLISNTPHLQGSLNPGLSQSLLSELGDSAGPSSCSVAENLRFELDQSELRQRELSARVRDLDKEAAELKGVVKDLQGQLSSVAARNNSETSNGVNQKLKAAEEERLAAKKEAEDKARHAERLSEQLKLREEELRTCEEKLAGVKARASDDKDEALARLEELQSVVGRIQGALTLKEKETGNLRAQLQGVQASLEGRERQAEELRKRLQEEREEVEQRCGLTCEELEGQMLDLRRILKSREKELAASSETIQHLEEQLDKLNDYKTRCDSLMEINTKLLQTIAVSETSIIELTESRAVLLDQLAASKASEKHLKARIEAASMNVEDKEQKILDENLRLEQSLQKVLLQKEELDARLKKLQQENLGLLDAQTSLKKTSSLESKEAPSKLVMAEAQLELNLREVTRLREEVMELRAQLLAGNQEKMKLQALQEVTAASREDLRMLVDQLKAQVEELNRKHVDDILRSQEREEALIRERDGEARARAGLTAEVMSCREEAERLKMSYDAVRVENGESREALHRANTETAELGVHVCMLTAEKEEARLRWEDLSTRLQELEEEATQEAERLNACVEQLRQENQELRCQLQTEEDLLALKRRLQVELSKAQQEVETLRTTSQEGIQVLQLHPSSQTASHDNQLQVRPECCQQIEEKNIQMAKSANLILQKEDELIHLKENLSRSEESLAAAQQACKEMAENLRRVTQDKQSFDLRTAAELDDLYRTKVNLEERLVELIREKDALWQKSDALEFEQKLRDEETERDFNYCLGCRTQFSWWLRKYNCRLCGRPFCYYCCSNTVSTRQGGSRESCCQDCYSQHSAVVERHPQVEVTHSTPGSPFSRLLQTTRSLAGVADEGEKLDDGVFDIITEEEVSGVNDTDSFTTACSPGLGQQGAAELCASAADVPSEDAEDLSAAVQDAEICLLKSGELTLSVRFTVDDILEFGDSPRELFIKSSCYSIISITMSSPGPTVSWTFTSEPKRISFSVVYRENAEAPVEQAKVLIPLTRCNSHKETIQGELKVRNPGEYILIFDNSFSRFISKKVLYHLSLDKPVVYDGTDLL